MKKLFLLTLSVALFGAMSLQAQQPLKGAAVKAYSANVTKNAEVRTAVGVINSTPAPQVVKAANHAPEAGMAEVTLSVGDVWGDGSG